VVAGEMHGDIGWPHMVVLRGHTIFSLTSAWVSRGERCGRLDRSFNPSSLSAS